MDSLYGLRPQRGRRAPLKVHDTALHRSPLPGLTSWGTLVNEQTTVLLGAGASADAGVPVSANLTRAIVDRIGGGIYEWSMALNVAIGAITAHDTARGGGAFDGVDVERLFSAVQMLAERDNLEIAPFVASWSPALNRIGAGEMPSLWARKFRRELGAKWDREFEALFIEGVRAVTAGRSEAAFASLQSEMIEALRECLFIAPGASNYLEPLLDLTPSPARIATLNYDRSVEQMGEATGRKISTGLSKWNGGGLDWSWDEGAEARVLKLHGSIDWYVEQTRPRFPLDEPVFEVGSPDSDEIHFGELGIVFGQRGKLRSDGPFLAMLREFERWLDETDRLVVIGYSFRDEHINALIRRWFNRESSGGLTIIDPFVADLHSALSKGGEFLRALLQATTENSESGRLAAKYPHVLLGMNAASAIVDPL